MIYYIKEGNNFTSIQSYEVADAFNSGVTIYRDDLKSVVTNLDEEELAPREMHGMVLGNEVTYVGI